MYFLLKMVIFHCYFSLPEGTTVFAIWLVVSATHLKNMLVELDIFPIFRGEHVKCLKPPVFAILLQGHCSKIHW